MKSILSICIVLCSISISAQDISILDFELQGQDSIFKCKLIDRYKDFVRYINNVTDQNVDSEIRRHSHIALYRLLASDELLQKGNSAFSIFDQSLEDLTKPYQRSEYLRKLENLTTLNYAYEKEFVTHGCPNQMGYQPRNKNGLEDGTEYWSPNLTFSLEFLEKSIKSDTITSGIRSGERLDFIKYIFSKNLTCKYSKLIIQDDYKPYAEKYLKLCQEYENRRYRDTRNEENKARLKEILEERIELESHFVYYSTKFNSITEAKVKNLNDKLDYFEESAIDCNCVVLKPLDSDGDYYPDVVDCNPLDESIYPGAPINCDNDCEDDNCDGVKDLCCTDNDGDGYYSAIGCDCNDDVSSIDIFAKCDCNDDPAKGGATIFPGADIDCTNGYPDDNCDGIPDNNQMQRGEEIYLNGLDYAYAPYGLTKFGKDGKFYAYSGLLTVGLASTVYNRNRSLHFYNLHRTAETLITQNNLYEKANDFHHAYLISAYSTLTVYLVSMLDLKLQYKRYDGVRNELDQRRRDCAENLIFEFKPLDVQYGYTGPKIVLSF